ncbi:MAG: hypothetical protein ABIJ27_03530 [Candidatus Omnitrophota bacterium]
MLVYAYFRNFWCAVASWCAGVFIDLDHLYDYFASRRFTFDIFRIYRVAAAAYFRKLYLILHSYEIVIILWAAIALLPLGCVWVGIAIGITHHIVLDNISNPVVPYAYFFLYRARKGFKRNKLIVSKQLKKRGRGKIWVF